ncbi:MAG: phage minor head protein [Alphaproteobacteria bacterium]
MAEPGPLSGMLHRPFAEQVAAFRARLGELRGTARWDDLRGAEHDRAFMVAGAMKAELLADLALALDRAIAGGATLEDFRRDFREIVARHGWHGWTGEGTAKGEAWRTRVIWQTNMRTSYAAGRMAQLAEGNFAFWIYRHGGSAEPRPQHLAWDGLMLPPDHPFWQTHAPPNGWGCSCYITAARSEAMARRMGGDPEVRLDPGWNRPDPRTGVPPGIDRGWAHAPGATATETVRVLRGKLEQLPERPAIDLIQDWLGSSLFEAWMRRPEGTWPLARLPEADAGLIGARTRVAVMSAETMGKQLRAHPELGPRDYMLAQRAVDEAAARVQDGPRSLVYALEIDGDGARGGLVVVVKATRTGAGLFILSLRRMSRDEARRDAQVAKLLLPDRRR